MHPKKILKGKKVFKKQGVWRFDFLGLKIILTKGCSLVVCQVQNADLIAVNLACSKDPKNL